MLEHDNQLVQKRRTVIACSMVEDELRAAMEELDIHLPVVWMTRGLHNHPETLREAVQEEIDRLQEQDELLLTYGLCGTGLEGICSSHTRLILPCFHDCIHMLLQTKETLAAACGAADAYAHTCPGHLYLTRGWTLDREGIKGQCEALRRQYDPELYKLILNTMYGSYHTIDLIDTGCYAAASVEAYARQAASCIDARVAHVAGSNQILRALLLGDWEEHFICLEPGEGLTRQHYHRILS